MKHYLRAQAHVHETCTCVKLNVTPVQAVRAQGGVKV